MEIKEKEYKILPYLVENEELHVIEMTKDLELFVNFHNYRSERKQIYAIGITKVLLRSK